MTNRRLVALLVLVAALVVGLGQVAAAERLVPSAMGQAGGRFAEQREAIADQRAELREIMAVAREKMQLISEKLPQLRRSRDFATYRAVLELKQDNLRLRTSILEIRIDKLSVWQGIATALEQGDYDAVEAALEQVIQYNAELIDLSLQALANLDAILALLP